MSSLAPQSINASTSLAYFYKTKGDIDRGTSVFQKAIELHPTNPYAGFNYALWLSYLNDCEQELDAVCPARNISKGANNLYVEPLRDILFFKNNEKTCSVLKDKISCGPGLWSVYATDGIYQAISKQYNKFTPF